VFGLLGDIFLAPSIGISGFLQRFDAATGARLWELPLRGGGAGPAFAASAQDVLCSDGAGGVHRVASLTGAVQWSSVLPSPAISVLASGGTVFASLQTCGLRALGFSTGELRWAWEPCEAGDSSCGFSNPRSFRPVLGMANGASDCPVGGCDTVFVVARAQSSSRALQGQRPGGGFLAALNAMDGSERWRAYAPSGGSTQYYSGVVLAAGRLLYSEGMQVHARNASTGALLYTALPLGLTSQQLGYTPIAARDGSAVFFSIPSGGLYRLNPATGDTVWSRGFSVYFSTGALDGEGRLYLSDYNGVVRALAASSGELLWEWVSEPAIGFAATSSLALGPSRTLAVVGTSGADSAAQLKLIGPRLPLTPPSTWPTVGFSLAGTSHGTSLGPPPGSAMGAVSTPIPAVYSMSSPVFGARGEVFVAGDTGTLVCVDAGTGAVRWSFESNANAVAPPFVHGGMDVLLADWGGFVYRLDAASGVLLWGVQASPSRVSAPVLVSGGRVFFADEEACCAGAGL